MFGLLGFNKYLMNLISILFLFIVIGFYMFILKYFKQWISSISRIPRSDWLLVLGAGVENNNRLSPILEDRLISAIKYARKYNPKHIILSGTKKELDYNEPAAMMNFLLFEGIDRDSIVLDESGFSTYHSCVNLKNKYNPEIIVIISQRFHLYRSLMISRLIGLQSYGLVADNFSFSNSLKAFWYFRESAAIPFNLIKMLYFHIFRN
jgi:SanA protein